MFERFTAPARQVVVDARHEARRRGDPAIGTEHLLLALLRGDTPLAGLLGTFALDTASVDATIDRLMAPRRQEHGSDAAALAALGIDLEQVRAAVEGTFGEGALARAASHDASTAPDHRRRRRWPLRRRRTRTRAHAVAGHGHIPFNRRAKTALELSLREAVRLRHNVVTAEHIALGLLREGQGLACAVLDAHGVGAAELRRAVEAQLLHRAA